jgi:ribosome biogenesis GTPase
MEGVVIKSTGSRYLVRSGDTVYDCVLKGRIRLEARKTTNPVAVGDRVELSTDTAGEPVIRLIHPRKNYIIRKSINLSKQAQILASNLDQPGLYRPLPDHRRGLSHSRQADL